MYVFRFLCLLLLPILCSSSSNNQFERVETCPKSLEDWANRAQKKNCQQFQATPDFMCAAIEGQPGNFGEICTVVGLSTKGKCAVLDADTYNLNFIKCFASSGCPPTAYRASDIYKYDACFGNFYRVQSTTLNIASSTPRVNGNSTIDDPAKSFSEQNTIVIVTFIVYVFLLSLLILFLMRRRLANRSKTDEDPATQKYITILTNYLRCRLLVLCDETNLRNRLLLHSESLKQNFNEHIVTELMHSTLNEVMKSSLNIIYMLLTNFCDIPTPRRGWGYRPDDFDDSLGGDIERIRSFVNEYLDTGRCSLEELKMVAERFKTQYEDINNEVEFNLSTESKINYIEIKPDCIEDSGTVVTEAIKQILNHLRKKDIAICIGSIGCGKTTAMDYVSKWYKERGWQIEWCENLMEESCINATLTLGKTIVCCDNLFGKFGCEVFSKDVFKDFENIIRKLLKQDEQEIKILLGVHDHVLDEIKSLGCYNIFQDKSKIIDMDSLSNSEILLIYQLQLKNNNHTPESLSYKDILDILTSRSDSVGAPFQTLMISTMPEEFRRKEFCNKPFEHLSEYFKKMFIRDKDAFNTLMYIMCVMIYTKEEDIDHSVSSAIDAYFDKNAIDFHLKDLLPFTLEDKYTVELTHELIGIAIFHAFFEATKSPWSIFTTCDNQMTLGLVRPADRESLLHRFAVPLSRNLFEQSASILKRKVFESKIENKAHPLMAYFSPAKTGNQ